MATGPYNVYQIANRKIVDNTVDLDNDTLGVMLLVDGHTVDLATHAFVQDVVADECTDTDYARLSVAGTSISLTGGKTLFDADNFDFGNTVTISARYVVIYRNVGPDNDATSEVLFICDLSGGGNLSSSAGNFDIINSNGIHEWNPNQ